MSKWYLTAGPDIKYDDPSPFDPASHSSHEVACAVATQMAHYLS